MELYKSQESHDNEGSVLLPLVEQLDPDEEMKDGERNEASQVNGGGTSHSKTEKKQEAKGMGEKIDKKVREGKQRKEKGNGRRGVKI